MSRLLGRVDENLKLGDMYTPFQFTTLDFEFESFSPVRTGLLQNFIPGSSEKVVVHVYIFSDRYGHPVPKWRRDSNASGYFANKRLKHRGYLGETVFYDSKPKGKIHIPTGEPVHIWVNVKTFNYVGERSGTTGFNYGNDKDKKENEKNTETNR